jgi:hypothetical protein
MDCLQNIRILGLAVIPSARLVAALSLSGFYLSITHAKRMSVASSCHGSALHDPDAAPEVEGSTMTGGKSGFGDE